ncbi:MAG TPA: hypothetical protein VGH24_09390 [Solirubrobacteraceae bacterium]|jgi:hypothetical protein
MNDEQSETDELRKVQIRREAQEQELAQASDDEEETAEHERRAEKARYLREKLEERAETEPEEK